MVYYYKHRPLAKEANKMQNGWLQRRRNLPKVHRDWLDRVEMQIAKAQDEAKRKESKEAK